MVLSMNKENAIEVNNITKSFKVYYDKGSELKEKMLFWKRNILFGICICKKYL